MTDFFRKHKEILLYLLFGLLTTAVNFIAFWLFGKLLGEKLYLVTNIIAWVISVIFAYFTNKLFVFESKSFALKTVIPEATEFLVARIFGLLIEEGGLFLLVDVVGLGIYSTEFIGFLITGQLIAKIAVAVFVVVANYFFSKFLIFKRT